MPTLRTIGVLADVQWRRGPVVYTDQPGSGHVTCEPCLNGTAHELYRPVPIYGRVVLDLLGMHEPAEAVAFITRYGFVYNEHGDQRRPAQAVVSELLAQAAELRDDRRLALATPSRQLLDDVELRRAADSFRAGRVAAFNEAVHAGASTSEGFGRAEALVPKLSLDARWRESATQAAYRQLARDQLTASLMKMRLRWSLDSHEAVVEFVPTSLLQLVSYALLLELRGDEAVGRCLECHELLPDESGRRGRPRLYCPPDRAAGKDCASAAESRQRREARRLARLVRS